MSWFFSCPMGSESKQGHGPFQLSIQIFLQGTECVILNTLKNSKNAPKKENYICVVVEHPSGESIWGRFLFCPLSGWSLIFFFGNLKCYFWSHQNCTKGRKLFLTYCVLWTTLVESPYKDASHSALLSDWQATNGQNMERNQNFSDSILSTPMMVGWNQTFYSWVCANNWTLLKLNIYDINLRKSEIFLWIIFIYSPAFLGWKRRLCLDLWSYTMVSIQTDFFP